MKILIVCDFFDEYAEYHEAIHARYLVSMGHAVSIICSTYTNIFEYYSRNTPPLETKKYNYHGAIIYRLPYALFLFKRLFFYKFLFKFLNESDPDLIYVHGINLNNLLIYIFKKFYSRKKIKLICDFHGDEFNSANNFLSKYILHMVIYRLIYIVCERVYDKLFAVSPSSINFLLKFYSGTRSKIELLPLGSDSLQIKRRKNSLASMQINHNDSDSSFTVITGGKLHADSRIDLLFESISKIAAPNKKIKLIIFGLANENFTERFESILYEYKDVIFFEYVGWKSTEEIIDLYLLSDIAVFLGGQSILWQLAISSGLPLVLSAKYCSEFENANSSYIDNGGNISYVDFANGSKQLSDKLSELAFDVELLNKMKANSVKVAEEVLDMNIIIKAILNVN